MMTSYNDDELIKAIMQKIDLLDYVSQRVDMQPHGDDWFGRCPFHQEKTPSFSVNPKENLFFCFGCGRGGSIIQYLMYSENLKYEDAVKKASEMADIDLSTMCQSQTVLFNKFLKQNINAQSEKKEHTILPYSAYDKYSKSAITEWLDEGIRQEEIDLFDIRKDIRSNRIVYPVYDCQGNLINIKGRTTVKDYKQLGIQKYINYYPVGTVDYFQSMEKALPYIEETGEVIIFEGIKSVMKLHGYGICNSVSAEKHTLTTEQIQILIRNPKIKSVVLAYDSDVSYTAYTYDKRPNKAVCDNVNILKRFVNLYVIEDRQRWLGGVEAKNSPIDCGIEVFNALYQKKRRVK